MNVLFISRDDAGCGQLARAWAMRFGMEARSAASHHPASLPTPATCSVLAGIEAAPPPVPRLVTPRDVQWADLVVVVDDSFAPRSSVPTVVWNLPGMLPHDTTTPGLISPTVRRLVAGLVDDAVPAAVALRPDSMVG